MSDGSSNTDDDHENDQTIPVFFLFFMLLFALVLLIGRALHNRPRLNSYLSEPAMVLLVSLFVSFLVKVFLDGDEEGEQQAAYDGYYAYNDDDDNDDEQSIYVDQNKLSKFLTTFSEEVFFMVFLPPIMFNSGYELKRELFFRHLKPILSFAVVGTAFSGTMTGMILWGITSLGWTGEAQLNMWELLTFGALITATDTVSVLGVLNAKQVNPHLFSLVFGESAFNDAVAIVLFQTFSHLVRLGGIRGQVVDEAKHFTIEFLWDVLGCPLLGLSISCAAALLFKIFDFGGTPVLELSLYLLIIYIPFITAEVLGMSGIITIFMTGMFARRYIEPNVSDETKHNAEVIFSLVAYMAETCIFLNLGLSVFGFEGDYHWSFIGFALMSSLIGRAMSIYPISFIYNWYLTEPVEGPPEPLHYRRKTVDEVSSKDIEDDITLAISSMKTSESADEASHNTPDIEFPTNDKGDLVISPGGTARSPGGTVRRTPAKKLDKVIPVKFMHFLWFAGLRGAVAYACARDFPDLYGSRDDIVAATTVIVFFSIIVMGACCEPLLHALNIRMGVDNDEYMREWRNHRSLDGRFHRLEKRFVYDMIVKDTSSEDSVEMEKIFHLTTPSGTLRQSFTAISASSERATTASATARTLTGSPKFLLS